MYQKLKRQLQRRLSSTSSLDANGGSTSGSSGSSKKPLLPETTKDTVRTIPPSSGNFSSNFGDTGIPAHAYVTLATAVIALSSVGPSFDLQHGVAPILKVYWRMTGTWIVLLIPTILAVAKDGWPKLNRQQAITFLGASFCYAVMGVGFVLSLEYTSVGNAVIFSNTNALILLFGRFLIGSPISALESGGSAVAFLGGILCTYDQAEAVEATAMPASESSVAEVAPIWQGILGDVIAVIAAAGGCCYLVLASTVRARFPSLYTFMFTNMLIGSQITLLCIVISGQEIEFSRDVHIGLFGFLSFRYDRLPLEMFLVCICNLTGSMGYLRSTIYFDNLVISVATLMEPVVASSLAYGVGVGSLPGFLGMVGNILVGMGTLLVINPGGAKKKESCN